MSDASKKKPAPFSLRLSQEERMRLERDAAGMSLASYVRWKLFDPASPPPKSRGKFPVKDHAALSQVLAMLGQSRLANNLNQLARAANTGSLPLIPETDKAIKQACAEITLIRRLLLKALGLDGSAP